MNKTYLLTAMTTLRLSLVTLATLIRRNHPIPQNAAKRPKGRRIGFAFLLTALLGSCVTTELRAQVVVVPNALATNDGNTFLDTPTGPSRPARLMQIFDASQFGSLSGPAFITQIAHRPDTISGPSGPHPVTLQIFASTTSRSVASLSTTFADNLGTNNTLVFSGTVIETTENLPGPGNTRQFDIVHPFTTPFLYDPAAGNLLLDFQISGAGGSPIRRDAVTGNPTVNSVAFVGSATAPTADRMRTPLPIQFTFELPPLVTIRASQVEVCWNSLSNLTYQVQYRSDLTTDIWTSLGDCIRSTGSTTCIQDPVVVGQPQRVYRVVQTNCVPD